MNTEMWETENFIVANGMSELGNPLKEYDASPFDYFDGGLDEDIDMDFSDATGRQRNSRLNTTRRNPRNTQSRTAPVRRGNKSMRIEPTKRRSAIGSVNPLKSRRKNLSSGNFKGTPRRENRALRNADNLNIQTNEQAQLSIPTIPIEVKKTMTPTMKNGLFIGGTALAIVVGYILFKKFKKK